jgi:hypothetical protein
MQKMKKQFSYLLAKYGRYAPILLAPAEGLPSRARKGSLRSLPIARTQGLATLASHRAYARARYARFTSRARKSSLHSTACLRNHARACFTCLMPRKHCTLALIVCHGTQARGRFDRLPCNARKD